MGGGGGGGALFREGEMFRGGSQCSPPPPPPPLYQTLNMVNTKWNFSLCIYVSGVDNLHEIKSDSNETKVLSHRVQDTRYNKKIKILCLHVHLLLFFSSS